MGDRDLPRRLQNPAASHELISTFDPALHGFGFRNPVGVVLDGVGNPLQSRLDGVIYGRGLCFGMAVAALSNYVEVGEPISYLRPSPVMLRNLRRLHLIQFRPDVAMRVALYWLRSRGGRSDYALERLRTPERRDPHIVCFGPSANRNFIRQMQNAHAVVPYRKNVRRNETRAYVYDPNHPKDRSRYISFDLDGNFRYGGFDADSGCGISIVPLSSLGFSRSGGSATRPR